MSDKEAWLELADIYHESLELTSFILNDFDILFILAIKELSIAMSKL